MGKSHRRDNYRWNDSEYEDYNANDRRKVKDDINRRKLKRMKNDLRSRNWQSINDYDEETT